MYTITKQFGFSASHVLTGLPVDHPCARLHGHNYAVEVVLQSPRLNEVGFVRDYRELAALKTYLDERFDHQHLNAQLDENPTAENLARHLFEFCIDRWPETVAVRVSETPRTWAEWRPRKGL